MDWHFALGVASGVVQISSIVPYVRSMLKGTTRPNIVSWILWTALQVIAIAAQLTSGASWSVIFLMAMTFNTSLVVILALRGYGYKKYGLIDYTCFFLAIGAIVLWYLTSQPVIAIIMSVLADFIAAVPTVVKTIKDPFSEDLSAWALLVLAATLGILSTKIHDAANLLFPGYILCITLFMVALIFIGQRFKKTI